MLSLLYNCLNSVVVKTMLIKTRVCRDQGKTKTKAQQHQVKTKTVQRQFKQCKFLHQMKQFGCDSVFLLHDSDMLAPLKPQTSETGFQNAISWNRSLLSGCANWQTAKLVTTVTMLMLTLTLMLVLPKQVEYDDSLLRQIRVLVL